VPCREEKELKKMEYGFDGRILRSRSGKRLAEVDRNYVRNDTGTRIGEIDRNYIKDSQGRRIADFDDEYIKDSSGRTIATIKDVQKVIRGPGGISLVALWLLVVR
jgi:hypothetical protein